MRLLSTVRDTVTRYAGRAWAALSPAPTAPEDPLDGVRVTARQDDVQGVVARAVLNIPSDYRHEAVAAAHAIPTHGPLAQALAVVGLKAWHAGESLSDRATVCKPFVQALNESDTGIAARLAGLALQVPAAHGAAAAAACHAALNMAAHPTATVWRDALIQVASLAMLNAGLSREGAVAARPFLQALATDAPDARTRRLADLALQVEAGPAAGGASRVVLDRLRESRPLLLKHDLIALAHEAWGSRILSEERIAAADPFLRQRATQNGPEARLIRCALAVKPEDDVRAAAAARRAVLKRLQDGRPLDLPRDFASVGLQALESNTDPSVQVQAARPFLRRLARTHDVARLALKLKLDDQRTSELYGQVLRRLSA